MKRWRTSPTPASRTSVTLWPSSCWAEAVPPRSRPSGRLRHVDSRSLRTGRRWAGRVRPIASPPWVSHIPRNPNPSVAPGNGWAPMRSSSPLSRREESRSVGSSPPMVPTGEVFEPRPSAWPSSSAAGWRWSSSACSSNARRRRPPGSRPGRSGGSVASPAPPRAWRGRPRPKLFSRWRAWRPAYSTKQKERSHSSGWVTAG